MVLTLNSKQELYKEFYGRNYGQMPHLIAEGRVPMSVSQIMQRRLDVRGANNSLKSSWMDNHFDTGDAVVYHPDGRVKIVLDSQYLRQMTSESKRNGGALVLIEDDYKTMEGEEFKNGIVGKTGEWLSKKDAKDHPIWKVLARDQSLLNDYVDYIFSEGKQRFGFDNGMGVFLSSAEDSLEMRAWSVSRLVNRSGVSGWSDLDCDFGRFLGIAPEAQSVNGDSQNSIQSYTFSDLEKAKKQLINLEKFVKPEYLTDVSLLISKL